MSDYISRQAVLDMLEDINNHIIDGYGYKHDWCVEWVKGLPSIDAVPRWILCRERLPEDMHEVLCCTDEDEMFVATAYIYEDGYDFDDNEGMAWRGEVVAWMPLPKPPKGDE